MKSLRSRLILGVALVAIVPLALGMALLSWRIERTVGEQAAERLDVSLSAIRHQLASDADRTARQLAILGRDGTLKRLLLLRPAGDRDLPDFLAQQRFLLGLDFLSVADTAGHLLADAVPLAATPTAAESAWREVAARPRASDTVAIESLPGAAGLALGASAPIPYENVRVGTLIGGRALDQALLRDLERTSGVELSLDDPAGRTIATTVAGGTPRSHADTLVRRVRLGNTSYLGRSIVLDLGSPPHASLVGLVPTAASDRTIAALRGASLGLALVGLAVAILLGVWWSSQVSRPVERLAGYSARLARGEWDEPLEVDSVRELETLVAALDRMRSDLHDYRARLVVSERHAAWSQMARRVAHEVKNPLTPIAISVADLKRSYDKGHPDFPKILEQASRTISEEVESLKRILDEFSQFGRLPAPRFQPCDVAGLFADLGALYAREVQQDRLAIAAGNGATLEADPDLLRQALVNLVKNALESAPASRVRVSARRDDGSLVIEVVDDGPGLDAERRAQVFVPGFTTKTQGSGLGLAIVERIVSDHHGTISVESAPGQGTTFRIRLPLATPART